MVEKGDIPKIPLKGFVAAVSVGIVDGNKLLDLSFQEDSNALVDMNVVMTDKGEIVEIQKEYNALKSKLEEMYEEWENLSG